MFGLPDPGQIGLNVLASFKAGQEERQGRDYKNALAGYAMNPSDQGLGQIAQYNPEFVMAERQRQQQAQQQQQQADVQRRAAQGDPAAVAELAGIDLDAWAMLDTHSKQAAAERVDVIGQVALAISQAPREQRAQLWDQYSEQLAPQYPELGELKGKYSEQALMGALAQAKQIKTFIDLTKPQAFNVGPGEGRYERDPRTGEISTIVQPYYGGGDSFSPVDIPPPPAGFQLDGGPASAPGTFRP